MGLFWTVLILLALAVTVLIAAIFVRFFSLLKHEETEERQKALEELNQAADEVVDLLKEHLSPLIRLVKAFGQMAIIAIRGNKEP